MFRSGRRSMNVDHNAGNNSTTADSFNSSPLEELSSLLDKLETLVDASMNDFLDSLITKTSGGTFSHDNNQNEGRGNGILNSLKHRFRKPREQQEPHEEGQQQPLATVADKSHDQTEFSTKFVDISEGSPTKEEKKRSHVGSNHRNKHPDSRFVPMSPVDTERFVETVRRISELVVVGESAAAIVQAEEAKLRSLIMHKKANTIEQKEDEKNIDSSNNDSDRDGDDKKAVSNKFVEEERKLKEELLEEQCASIRETISEKKELASVYEHFFERNGLAIIAEILTGKAFNLPNLLESRKLAIQSDLKNFNNAKTEESKEKDSEKQERAKKEKYDRAKSILKSLETISETETYSNIVLLPPLAVATQGFQSTSILVQNVKRATSLFFILSNNHINQLISFPLEEYHIAERNKLEGSFTRNESSTLNSPRSLMSPRRFASAELGELTTTFISFLKSLALRMNAETLQFFLTYPADTAIEGDTDYLEEAYSNSFDDDTHDEERPLDEIVSNAKVRDEIPVNRPITVKTIKVEFPLYERALEFCSAHHDSFVRVTAMNICLNTLRLTTVEAKTKDEEPGEVAEAVKLEAALGASPDAILHNAKALPLRERLAIAQYVCTPSRVERLASPVFTKLAQLWGLLEEQFRDMEIAGKVEQSKQNDGTDVDDNSLRKKPNDKVARAREIARRKKFTQIFNDTSYNLQDELLLLEDMLKVGLTSLNEQVIEMMFATFVYPLLLQPLLLYFQRSPVAAEVLFADTLSDHSLGNAIKQSDATVTEKAVISAPAKSALFCLAAAFQFLTNPPLLRLLFTAVFHPLSPDATGETMIRAKADVACMGKDGKATLRIDRMDEHAKMITDNDRDTYTFGTVTGRKETSGRQSQRQGSNFDDACVFVLSPALSEILNFSGQDGGLVARSRHNPYRKAIFQCFTLNKEVSDLQDLAVMAVDSAVSVFDEKFLADLLFGLDIKRYKDNLPTNKRFDSFRGDNENQSDFDDDLDDRGIGGSIAASVDARLTLGALKGGKLGFDYMGEVINSITCSIMSAAPGGKGAWKLNYDMVAVNALLSSIRGDSDAILRAFRAVKVRFHKAAAFLADVPATIDTIFDSGKLWGELKNLVPVNGSENDKNDLYYGAIMDMIVRRNKDDGFADAGSILNHMLYLTKDLSDNKGDISIFVSVSAAGSYDAVGIRACTSAPLETDAAGAAFSNAVGSTSAVLKLNSFVSLLKDLCSSEKLLRYLNTDGFIFNRPTDEIIPNPSSSMTIFSPISDILDNAVFGINNKNDSTLDYMKSGSITSLVGKVAFPCVCEVPPSMAPLFSTEGAKVVSQGITWQSLYLAIVDENIVLVEPERRSNGQGRVVTVCRLENLTLDKDPDDARVDTSARRLILIHESPDLSPPGMFRFEKKVQPQQKGPFSRVKRWKSSLDIWFEDSNALRVAFTKVFEAIVREKANRGNRIRRYLAHGEV